MPWDYKSFITNYIGIPIYAIAYIGFKRKCCGIGNDQIWRICIVIRKTKAVKMSEMDLTTGAREFQDLDEETDEEQQYKLMSFKQKVIYQIKNW